MNMNGGASAGVQRAAGGDAEVRVRNSSDSTWFGPMAPPSRTVAASAEGVSGRGGARVGQLHGMLGANA